MLEAALGQEGYRFSAVTNAADARHEIAESRPNLLINDVLLPGGEDGISLARHAGEQGVPSILVTGNHTLQEALEATSFAYLLKPFRVSALVKAVQQILRAEGEECAIPGEGAA
jgi:two-component system phosphate regulon response regulator OmpR